jgi:REP element-mobilizing transposase RayT
VSRPLRLDHADAIHHVTARGNAQEALYRDEADRLAWREILAETVARFSWLVLAYCQMGNHYHLLLETPRPTLSRGMRHLNGVYAQRFNARHGRVGHVFQARFHTRLVERDDHLLAVAAYIASNPVRAGLCGEPASWRWSSYRATIGLEPPGFLATDRLLSFFGESRERARERYRSQVQHEPTELAELGVSVFCGSERFAAESTRGLGPIAEVPRSHWQPVRPSLGELLPRLENASIARAYLEHGYTMREIATHLGVHYATVSRRLRRHSAQMAQMSECKT